MDKGLSLPIFSQNQAIKRPSAPKDLLDLGHDRSCALNQKVMSLACQFDLPAFDPPENNPTAAD